MKSVTPLTSTKFTSGIPVSYNTLVKIASATLPSTNAKSLTENLKSYIPSGTIPSNSVRSTLYTSPLKMKALATLRSVQSGLIAERYSSINDSSSTSSSVTTLNSTRYCSPLNIPSVSGNAEIISISKSLSIVTRTKSTGNAPFSTRAS